MKQQQQKSFGDFMHKKMCLSTGYKKLAAWCVPVNEERMGHDSNL